MTTIIHPKVTDLDKVFQFMLACDIEEYGEGDSSREDLEEQWSGLDLEQDAWISCDEKGEILGYASLTSHDGRFDQDIYIHRRLTPQNLDDGLADLCLQRVKDIVTAEKMENSYITGYATGENHRLQQVYERHGFTRQTYHYRMQIMLDQPFAAVDWPANILLSNYEEKDEVELYELINQAFTWQGRTIPTLESWRSLIFRGGRYDPLYFVLLRDGGKLIGAALSYAEEAGGWIRQLAVAPAYQGKGLGGKLLRHMFEVFSSAGLPSVALSVASANSNAFQFYERNGMKKTREFIEYRLEIS